MSATSAARTTRWVVIVVIALAVVFGAVFLFELITWEPPQTHAGEGAALSYTERVATLLAEADPANGAVLVETYACTACHREGAANGVAPAFVGIADRAALHGAERQPPLPAAEYLYESITNPSAYVVEGYPNVMIQNFADRLTDRELGDMIAYLLTPDAR